MTLTTYGPIKPQHSGHYGSYAPNPGFQLAQLLASMKDKEVKVLIPGYYDGIKIDAATEQVLKGVIFFPFNRLKIAGLIQTKNYHFTYTISILT